MMVNLRPVPFRFGVVGVACQRPIDDRKLLMQIIPSEYQLTEGRRVRSKFLTRELQSAMTFLLG